MSRKIHTKINQNRQKKYLKQKNSLVLSYTNNYLINNKPNIFGIYIFFIEKICIKKSRSGDPLFTGTDPKIRDPDSVDPDPYQDNTDPKHSIKVCTCFLAARLSRYLTLSYRASTAASVRVQIILG